MGVGKTLVDCTLFVDVDRAGEDGVVVREAVRPFLSSDAHERLERAISREAATKEEEAVAGEQSFQQSLAMGMSC